MLNLSLSLSPDRMNYTCSFHRFFGIRINILPEIRSCSEVYGHIVSPSFYDIVLSNDNWCTCMRLLSHSIVVRLMVLEGHSNIIMWSKLLGRFSPFTVSPCPYSFLSSLPLPPDLHVCPFWLPPLSLYSLHPFLFPTLSLISLLLHSSLHPSIPSLPQCIGDQQATLVGQQCFNPGDAKNNGCFLLYKTGQLHACIMSSFMYTCMSVFCHVYLHPQLGNARLRQRYYYHIVCLNFYSIHDGTKSLKSSSHALRRLGMTLLGMYIIILKFLVSKAVNGMMLDFNTLNIVLARSPWKHTKKLSLIR